MIACLFNFYLFYILMTVEWSIIESNEYLPSSSPVKHLRFIKPK